jgi:hypothetical protein
LESPDGYFDGYGYGYGYGYGNGDRYAFAGGNPVSNVEQDGHSWLSTLTGAAEWTLGEAACNAAFDIETFGAGALGCAGAGAAIGGLSSQAVTCAQGGSCSPGAFASSALSNEDVPC